MKVALIIIIFGALTACGISDAVTNRIYIQNDVGAPLYVANVGPQPWDRIVPCPWCWPLYEKPVRVTEAPSCVKFPAYIPFLNPGKMMTIDVDNSHDCEYAFSTKPNDIHADQVWVAGEAISTGSPTAAYKYIKGDSLLTADLDRNSIVELHPRI